MIRRPPGSTRTDTLFPYTTLFRARQWGEKWGCGPASCQVLADGRDRQPIRKMTIPAHDGRVLEPGDLIWLCVDEETPRSEEHTSELQSLMRISYAVFGVKQKIGALSQTEIDTQ